MNILIGFGRLTREYIPVVFAICLFMLLMQNVGAATLYINQSRPTCNNSYTYAQAQSPATPWCDLTMINSFVDGDTVYICNGTYRQSSSDADISDKYLTTGVLITNYPGETPILTAEMSEYATVPNTRWTKETSLGSYVYSSSYATGGRFFTIYDNSNVTLMSYGSQNFTSSGVGCVQSYDECFATRSEFLDTSHPIGLWYNETSDRFYFRYNSTTYNPNSTALHITKTEEAILEIANVSGSGYLTIRGLTWQYGAYAIELDVDTIAANNIILENNVFQYFFRAIYARRGGNHTIRNNLFYNKPQADWFWQIYKSDHLGGTQMEGDAIKYDKGAEDNIEIYNNTFIGTFNGVYLYTDSNGDLRNSRVYDNNFTTIGDDAIELEDYGHNITVYNNTAQDCFVGISMAPFNSNSSMTTVSYNKMYCARSQPYSGLTTTSAGKVVKFERGSGQASNVFIHHNTLIGASGKGLVADNSNAHPIANVTVLNNIIYTNSYYVEEWTGLATDGVYYDYNLWYRSDGGYVCYGYNNQSGGRYYTLAACRMTAAGAASGWDAHNNT